MGESRSRVIPAEATSQPSWLRDIKPPKLENLVGVRVEQSEQAGYKNTY